MQRDRRRPRVNLLERGGAVVDAGRRLQTFADHGHIAFDHRGTLGAEFLGDLFADLFKDRVGRRARGYLLNVAGYRADEGDAHHARGQFWRRRVAFGDGEGVDDEEVDVLLADGLPRLRRQLGPDFLGRGVRLHDEGAAIGQTAQRVGMAERTVVGRDHDLDVFQLGVGDLDRLGR